MGRAGVLQEVRVMRFEDVLGRFQAGRLSCEEAADVLGMSVSSFYRWRRRHEAEGAEGLADRRLGKVSLRRAAVDEVAKVLELFETRYVDFNVKHFHEKLQGEHGSRRSYSWTKNTLQGAGKVKRAKRKGAHRRKRPRRPMAGMMLHQDGSKHRWIPGLERDLDLIATLDDATGAILSAFLVEEEGTMSTFRALAEVFARHGLPCSLYSDRGGHYFRTPKAGGKVAKQLPTQVGRALAQLGIEHIPAYSPQARGRSERAFGTLQDRLPKELRLAGIATVAAANRFLAEVFIADYNARFAVAPEQSGSAFVAVAREQWADVLCVQEERTVGNDNTVRFNGQVLQIPPSPLRPHYVKARVRVHHDPDATYAVFHGPRCLARYHADGSLMTDDTLERAA